MEVIIEQVGKAGTILSRQRFDQFPLSIGRSYINDVILEDPYVDTAHAQIEQDESGQLVVRDLGSTNGVYLNKQKISNEQTFISTGSKLTLGKSHLNFFDVNHPMPVALPVSAMESALHQMSRAGWLVIFVFILFCSLAFEHWLSFYGELKLQNYIEEILGASFAVLCYAVIWSVVGRVLRHDSRFKEQLLVAILSVLIAIALSFMTQWLAYSLDLGSIYELLDAVLISVLLFCLLKVNLFLATKMIRFKLNMAALLLPLVTFSILSFSYWSDVQEFSPRPTYSTYVLPPSLQSKVLLDFDRVDLKEFENDIENLFQQTDGESN